MVLSDHRDGDKKSVKKTTLRRKVLHRLMLLAVFVSLFYYVHEHLEQFTSQQVTLKWQYIVAALILTVGGHLASFALWKQVAHTFSIASRWTHAGKAWSISRLGRFVPGKLPLLLMRFNAYPAHTKTQVTAATFMELYTSLCAVMLLTVPAAFLTVDVFGIVPAILAAVTVPTVVFLVFLDPRFTKWGFDKARTVFPIPELIAFPDRFEMRRFSLLNLAPILLHGAALLMAFNALGSVEASKFLLITTAYYLAGLIGMLAVFSPSGLGVREGALLIFLAPLVDPATLLGGAVLMRVLGIFSELGLAGAFIVADRAISQEPGV